MTSPGARLIACLNLIGAIMLAADGPAWPDWVIGPMIGILAVVTVNMTIKAARLDIQERASRKVTR